MVFFSASASSSVSDNNMLETWRALGHQKSSQNNTPSVFESSGGNVHRLSLSVPLSLSHSLSLSSFEASGVYSTSRVCHSVPSRRPSLRLLVAAKTYGSLKVGRKTIFDVVTWFTVHG